MKQRLIAGIFTLLFCTFHSVTFSQGENNNWHFGFSDPIAPPIVPTGFDFNNSPPTLITNNAQTLSEGSASISDKYGNLLFYTEGEDLRNQNNAIMPNGAGIGGNRSDHRSSLIIPVPNNSDQFYVFAHDGGTGNSTGLFYSIVDMSLDNCLGDIIPNQKAIPLLDKLV